MRRSIEFVLIDNFSQFASVLSELSIFVIGGTFAYRAMFAASSALVPFDASHSLIAALQVVIGAEAVVKWRRVLDVSIVTLTHHHRSASASIATHSQLVFPDLPWKAYRLRSASGKLSSWVQSTSFFDRQLGDQLPGRVRLAQRGRPSSPLLHQPLRLRLTHTQARCNLDLELLETYNTLSFQFPRFCSTLVMPPSRSGKHPTIEREVKKLGVALTKRCDALSHALR